MAVNTRTLAPETARTSAERREARLALARWQMRLLPFMAGVLGVLTAFFFSATMFQLYDLHQRIERAPTLDVAATLAAGPDAGPTSALAVMRWRTLATLEAHALQRRYHQANVLLMARIWTQYLGFITGMMMAMVGATFILGKLRESATRASAEGAAGKFAMRSESPGLLLAAFGTVLMLTTMVTHNDIDVKDGPLYLSGDGGSVGTRAQPEPWPTADPGAELGDAVKKDGAPAGNGAP